MNIVEEDTSRDEWDESPTMILSAEQRRSQYQRRSALLSGLLPVDASAKVSIGLAEVIEHREQFQARQTRALGELIQHELERKCLASPQQGNPEPGPIPSKWPNTLAKDTDC